MKKRTIIVVGIERNGTRALTNMIIKGGAYGDHTHEQKLDALFFKDTDTKKIIEYINKEKKHDILVIRRSLPHNGRYIDIEKMIQKFDMIDYPVSHVVVIIRDYFFTMISQKVSDKILPKPANFRDLNREQLYQISLLALSNIINVVVGKYRDRIEIIPVTYEAIINYQDFMLKKLKEKLKLPQNIEFTVIDGNKKYVKN